MLAFLNACQTAEAGRADRSWTCSTTFGFTGAIVTERQTIDNFANEFGLAFLQGFLREGKPLGELLHGLRLQSAPLGLLYGGHCPPEIRVRIGNGTAVVPAPLPIRESGPVAGVPWARSRRRATEAHNDHRRGRSYGLADAARCASSARRAIPLAGILRLEGSHLFTGRDADVVRFAATLDRPDTRILILHGESGTGKSSFLRRL